MRPAPIPVVLADGTQHASVSAAARALGCSRTRVDAFIRAGKAPTPMVNVSKLARMNGIGACAAHWRIRNGWSVEDATTKPLRAASRAGAPALERAARILDAWAAKRAA